MDVTLSPSAHARRPVRTGHRRAIVLGIDGSPTYPNEEFRAGRRRR